MCLNRSTRAIGEGLIHDKLKKMEGTDAYEEEMQQQRFRRQLAAVVRNIQWSYAIFWSLSTAQPE
jgi:hypothetical protein